MIKYLLHIIFLIGISGSALFAQTNGDTALLIIPPVEELIASALEHSPLLKAKQKQTDIDLQDVSIQKREWMKYLYIEGAASYGMYDQVILQDYTSEQQNYNTGFLNQGEQKRYYGGLGVKLPIASLTNRNRELKKRKMIQERSDLELQSAQVQIKQIIIEAYYHLQYLDESMRTFYHIYQTLEIGYLKAEKDLLNGRTNLNEYALLASTVGKAKNDYQKAKSTFHAQYHKLMEITGMEF